MEDAGGMIEEHLQTELDDNGRMNLQHWKKQFEEAL